MKSMTQETIEKFKLGQRVDTEFDTSPDSIYIITGFIASYGKQEFVMVESWRNGKIYRETFKIGSIQAHNDGKEEPLPF